MIGTYGREGGVERVEKWCPALHHHLPPPPPPQERSRRHKTVGVSGLRDRDARQRKRRCETSGKVVSSSPPPPPPRKRSHITGGVGGASDREAWKRCGIGGKSGLLLSTTTTTHYHLHHSLSHPPRHKQQPHDLQATLFYI